MAHLARVQELDHVLALLEATEQWSAIGMAVSPSLTPAQRAVLERVAAGSNKAVARELEVFVNTVRAHLRAVFTRLEATSRTAAVARARARGLV